MDLNLLYQVQLMINLNRFDAIVKQQNFYMENDSIIFIYNKGEASNFADGEVFIPFLLTDLIGILK